MKIIKNDTQAYTEAVSCLESTGRAVVACPAGTDKSNTAWQLLATWPDAQTLWLVPDEWQLGQRQAELQDKQRTLPRCAQLLSCEALAKATPDQWLVLVGKRPEVLILDMYPEIGAACWSGSVERLLTLFPQLKILGLRETDGPDDSCRMATELFRGVPVVRSSAGEAMALGKLPRPTPLVSLLWPIDPPVQAVRGWFGRLSASDPNTALVAELERSATDGRADALNAIAAVVCEDGAYLVVSDSDERSRAFAAEAEALLASARGTHTAVYADGTVHPDGISLLLCANTAAAQTARDGIAGVILLRESTDSRVFRQMLCRALTACGHDVPVLDICADFDGMTAAAALARDYAEAARSTGNPITSLTVREPLRRTVRVYRQLSRAADAAWDVFYEAARAYAAEHGDLAAERSYTTEQGVALGRWLENQRRIRAGQREGRLTEAQIEKLDGLGIEWKQRLVLAWERCYAAACKYRAEHGDLLVPVRYCTRDGFALGEWIVYNRQRYLRGSLSQERIDRLNAIGMVWDTVSDLWTQSYAAAARYYIEHGNLEIPVKYTTADGMALGIWLGSQRAAYKAGELTAEQVAGLEALSIDWANRNDHRWQTAYQTAERYYQAHGDLDVPSEYIDENGVLLGKWISRQRYAYQNPDRSSARVTPDRKAKLDRIGMIWDKGDPWQLRYDLAIKYKNEHGGAMVPSQYRTEDGIWLGSWLGRQKQRLRLNDANLTLKQRTALRILLQDELDRNAAAPQKKVSVRDRNWQENYRRARIYAKKHGDLLVPAGFIDETGCRLGIWISNLRAARKSRPDSFQVTPEHIAMLDAIGMEWDAREAKWNGTVRRAQEYRAEHGDLHMPVNYKTSDGFCLGDWLRRVQDSLDAKDSKLTESRIADLRALGLTSSEQN